MRALGASQLGVLSRIFFQVVILEEDVRYQVFCVCVCCRGVTGGLHDKKTEIQWERLK